MVADVRSQGNRERRLQAAHLRGGREARGDNVASRLNPEGCYGLWWFNEKRYASKQAAENGPNGRRYRRKITTTRKPRSEWAAIKGNRKPSSNGDRFWELSGGIAWCGLCGSRMRTHVINGRDGRKRFYYTCWRRGKFGEDGCPRPGNYQAQRWSPQSGSLSRGYYSGLQ